MFSENAEAGKEMALSLLEGAVSWLLLAIRSIFSVLESDQLLIVG
jgi:hypothetical protein